MRSYGRGKPHYIVHGFRPEIDRFDIACLAGRDENVRANLRQYSLEHRYLDMLVADAAVCVWRRQEIFDAIVTDRKTSTIIYSL